MVSSLWASEACAGWPGDYKNTGDARRGAHPYVVHEDPDKDWSAVRRLLGVAYHALGSVVRLPSRTAAVSVHLPLQ